MYINSLYLMKRNVCFRNGYHGLMQDHKNDLAQSIRNILADQN